MLKDIPSQISLLLQHFQSPMAETNGESSEQSQGVDPESLNLSEGNNPIDALMHKADDRKSYNQIYL